MAPGGSAMSPAPAVTAAATPKEPNVPAVRPCPAPQPSVTVASDSEEMKRDRERCSEPHAHAPGDECEEECFALDDVFGAATCCDALGPECDCDCIPFAYGPDLHGQQAGPVDGGGAAPVDVAPCIRAHGGELHWHLEENHAFFADSGCAPALCPGESNRVHAVPTPEDSIACELEGHHHLHHQHQVQTQLFVPTDTVESLSGVIFPGCSLGPAVQCWSSHTQISGDQEATGSNSGRAPSPAPTGSMDVFSTSEAPSRTSPSSDTSAPARPHHHHIIHHHHASHPFRALSINDANQALRESFPSAVTMSPPPPAASCGPLRSSLSSSPPAGGPAFRWHGQMSRPGKRKLTCSVHGTSDGLSSSPPADISGAHVSGCLRQASCPIPLAGSSGRRNSPFACPMARAEPRPTAVAAPTSRRESLTAPSGLSSAPIVSSASSVVGSTPSSGDEASTPISPSGRPGRSSPTPSDATEASSVQGAAQQPRRRGRRPRSMLPDPSTVVPLPVDNSLTLVYAPLEPGQAPADPSAARRRLVWTSELHGHFCRAVEQLGLERATPKALLSVMGIEGLKLEHIKSHLQKFRASRRRGLDFIADGDEDGTASLPPPTPAPELLAALVGASPPLPPTPHSAASVSDFPSPCELPPPEALPSRLADLERQLEAERRARAQLEAALEAERRARAAVEGELARHRAAAAAAASLLAAPQ